MTINYRGLNIPHVSFGAVTSDDLFCAKEQAIFDFYEASGKAGRYKRALDIGANIGVHSILMARQGWEVLAYEPDPELYRQLRQNVDAHEIMVGSSRVAVSDRADTAVFVRVKDNLTGSHLKGDKVPYGELEEFEVTTVDCRPLFHWASRGPGLAKIDCEGHEAIILCTVTENQALATDFMVEVGNQKNAEAIYHHFATLPTRMWAQKNDWRIVQGMADMPTHHSHGALFISPTEPLP